MLSRASRWNWFSWIWSKWNFRLKSNVRSVLVWNWAISAEKKTNNLLQHQCCQSLPLMKMQLQEYNLALHWLRWDRCSQDSSNILIIFDVAAVFSRFADDPMMFKVCWWSDDDETGSTFLILAWTQVMNVDSEEFLIAIPLNDNLMRTSSNFLIFALTQMMKIYPDEYCNTAPSNDDFLIWWRFWHGVYCR